MKKLLANSVAFYSHRDEEIFFRWLKDIPSIDNVEGFGHCIVMSISREVPDKDLRELLAVFRRYDVDMRQLETLVSPGNRHWFADPSMAWHASVFGPEMI